MGWNDPDIYYNPEKFGLETIGEFELSEPDYSFDIVLVQRHAETGAFYVNQDSGCSCPSPFEDFGTLESAGDPLTAHEAARKIQTLVAERWDKDYTPDYLPVIGRVMAIRGSA